MNKRRDFGPIFGKVKELYDKGYSVNDICRVIQLPKFQVLDIVQYLYAGEMRREARRA